MCSAMTIILWYVSFCHFSCICLKIVFDVSRFTWWNSRITFLELEGPREISEISKSKTYFAFALLTSIVTIIISTILFALRKRIQLAIALFQEAGKAISSMPFLIFQPILVRIWGLTTPVLIFCLTTDVLNRLLYFQTVLWLAVVIGLSLYSYIGLERTRVCSRNINYDFKTWIIATKWYLFFAVIWFINFIIGCHHMVIAGAISQWYFKRYSLLLRIAMTL